MGTRKETRSVHGIVLLDKPAGATSNRVLQTIKHLFNAKKAGHTGSLDPFATGLLPLCFGDATKISGFLLDADKRYTAIARLGEKTDTGDVDGDVVASAQIPGLDQQRIQAVMQGFMGTIEQVPPMYSALKQGGTPLYKLARAGKEVPRPPRKITIFELNCLEWQAPDLRFEVHCSKGTYVRTLAEDLAIKLGTVAHLRELRRTAAGAFSADNMTSVEELQEHEGDYSALDRFLLPLDTALPHMGRVLLDDNQLSAYCHGRRVEVDTGETEGLACIYASGGICVGIGELRPGGLLVPKRLFPGLVPKNLAG